MPDCPLIESHLKIRSTVFQLSVSNLDLVGMSALLRLMRAESVTAILEIDRGSGRVPEVGAHQNLRPQQEPRR